MNESPSTPARLVASATAKLPRLGLLGLGVLYLFAGLFLRDPWKTDDVVGTATMLSALRESGALLLPHIGAMPLPQEGPLVVWAGALCLWLFVPLLEHLMPTIEAVILAARAPNLLWFALLTYSVWYGSYLLGRRPEPQPLALPFGGEPHARDYGRMIADAALLLILATAGIVWRMHETSSVPALIAWQALAFYAVTRMLDRPLLGALALGVSLGAAWLTRGWPGALPIMLAALCCFAPGGALWRRKAWLLLSAAIAAAMMLAWWLAASRGNPAGMEQWLWWNLQAFDWPHYRVVSSMLRDLPWFLWPTWPFALLALWRWRAWRRAPHVWVPAMFLLWPLLTMAFMSHVFEPEYSLLAVPSAVLAAFALPTLRRGLVNSLDWFAVMCFTLTCATVWLGWIALQTGWPEQIAHNIARQTRDYVPVLSWPAVLIALLGTAGWLALVRWRLKYHPAALWRGTVLSACGLAATWLLLVTLWMPALDYARSYRAVSAELSGALRTRLLPGECVRSHGLGTGQRASFLVFDDIEFTENAACRVVLQQTSTSALLEGTAAYDGGAQVLWQGSRAADRHEVFRLLRLP